MWIGGEECGGGGEGRGGLGWGEMGEHNIYRIEIFKTWQLCISYIIFTFINTCFQEILVNKLSSLPWYIIHSMNYELTCLDPIDIHSIMYGIN